MPRGKMHRATCPHCGKESTAPAMGRHVPICIANPDNRARLLSWLTAHDDVGITYSEYMVLGAEHGAPGMTTLRRMTGFNSWDDILAWFGLRPAVAPASVRTCPVCGRVLSALGYARHYKACGGGAEAQSLAREVENEAALIKWEGELLEQDAITAQWLFVGDDDPRKPNYKPPIIKPAPGLRVNGRECVRVELR